MSLIDVQIDRLVGPTHHFGGMGVGNVASQRHAGQVSNPQAAALQGLDKMRLVAEMGVPQWILPPQPRPDFEFLRRVGFFGTDAELVKQAIAADHAFMSASISSSAMWVANAATVSAGVDNRFGRSALTVANLNASLHRSIEPDVTFDDLTDCLGAASTVLRHLSGGTATRDEGAANHMRLGSDRNEPGIHVFVYGDGEPAPRDRWPRQSRAACEAIARQHGLNADDTFYLKQHPDAIDAGAFHNDVVAASHRDRLIHHEKAFDAGESTLAEIRKRYEERYRRELRHVVVPSQALSVEDAVSTYLFNSQIVSTDPADDQHVIICPMQVKQHVDTERIVATWCEQGLFDDVRYVDLLQSMSGGGGPACLRLRVPMTPSEIEQLPQAARWSDSLDHRLRERIRETYPTRFAPEHLSDETTLGEIAGAHQSIRELLVG